jgi:hypothetical protein
MHTQERVARYFWQQEAGPETCYSLVDRVSSKPVASITYLNSNRKWRWSRHTCQLLHGAGASAGVTRSLADAKAAVVDGLPNEICSS